MAESPFISKFAPKSFFFTDQGVISQTAAQAFGPVSTDLTNKYRLTAKFNVSAGKAYAVCRGVVLVQPQTGQSGKVNIILRPYTQPINGINIKYFIYRGLNKNDFFTGNQVIAAGSSTSDFINRINTSFTNYYIKTAQPKPDFLAKYIGFDPANQADPLELSDFFFKDSVVVDSSGQVSENDAFELPMVDAGNSLGSFVTGECGFDVVLSYGDYKLPAPNDEFVFNLGYARASEAMITLTSGMTDYQKKLKREQIFQFLDAAAYFGFHANENGWVQIKSGNAFQKKEGVAVYNDVINGFNTKNAIYLYIQSDRTRSYNFYGNYAISAQNANNLKFGTTIGNLVETAYGTSGWPVIINKATQTHSNPRNTLCMQFTFDDKENSMLYGFTAAVDNDQKNNFCNAEDLALPDGIDGQPSIFSKIVILSNPNSGSSGSKVNIASFNLIIYHGKYYHYEDTESTPSGTVLEVPNFFDDVFDLVTAGPSFANDSNFWALSGQKLKLVNHYFDQIQHGISSVQTTIVRDRLVTDDDLVPSVDRVIFTTDNIDILNFSTAISVKITNSTKSSPAAGKQIAANQTFELPSPYFYERLFFTDGVEQITGLVLKTVDNTIPNKIILGISLTEANSLKNIILSNGLNNSRLSLIDLFEDGNELISPENISYQKYKVGVVGEINGGELKLFYPPSELLVFSLDRNYHYSRQFSEFMPQPTIAQDYIIANIVI